MVYYRDTSVQKDRSGTAAHLCGTALEVAVLPSSSRTLTALLLMALVGMGLTSCSSSTPHKATVTAPSATGQGPGPSGAATTAPAGGTALTIATFAYDPTPLTVVPGAVIPVTNNDGTEHTVTSDLAGLFAANDIGHGKTITFSAPSKAGTYRFHCAYHPNMHGTLVVT